MSNEVLLQKAFPVIEGIPEQIFAELEGRNYKDFIPAEKNLSYITTCEKIRREYLEEFQQEMYNGLAQFGYPNKELKQKDSNNSKIDRWIGKFLYEKMEITPSIAATLGMWQFMNLYMFPSVVYWRWGNAKHRYISSIRNYCGTMWWRQYFFAQSPELEKVYIFLTEDEIVSLYERPRTRGLPDHIRNNVIWYRDLCKKYEVKNKEFYRIVIKNYNAELGFRNYYALNRNDLYQIYEEVFVSCLKMNQKNIQSVESILNLKEKSSTKESLTTDSVLKEIQNIDECKPSSNYIFANSTVLIVRNPVRKGIEITFETFPREIIKTEIKRIGFKYLSMERKWYAHETPKLLEDLKNIFLF